MKKFLRVLYVTSVQINCWIALSRACARIPVIGRLCSVLIDNVMLALYGVELTSSSLDINKLVVGHSTGVVLGGNGIRCTGTLHISSGVVFGRRYTSSGAPDPEFFFDIDGDLTIGANSVLLGPLKIKGPVTIGALTLVTKDIEEPGTYIGLPARRLEPR